MASIPVSDELRRTFETAQADQIRVILVQNQSNSLKLIQTLPPTSSDVSDRQEFSTLLGKVLSNDPNRSGYVLYRLDSQAASGDWEWICCAFQPESAKIKEKMQYALTRSSLINGLGERNFLELIFGSTPTDFNWPTNLRNQRKHDYQNPQLRTEGKPASEAAGTGVGGAKRFFGSRSPAPSAPKLAAEEPAAPVEPSPDEPTPAHASGIKQDVVPAPHPPPPALPRRDSNELTSAFKSPNPPEDDERETRHGPEPTSETYLSAPYSNDVTLSNGDIPAQSSGEPNNESAGTNVSEDEKVESTQAEQPPAPAYTEPPPHAKSTISTGYGHGTSKTGLTEREEELAKLEKLEAAERSNSTTGGGPKLGFKWRDGVREAIQGLASTASGTSEWNLVVISIDLKNEMLELDSPPRFVLPADLPGSLSEKEPRMAFYRLDDASIKTAGKPNDSGESVVAMLYCCPSSSSVKARMLYSTSVLTLKNHVNSFSGMRIVKKIESSDRNELTHSRITDEIEAFLDSERQKFAGTGIDAVVSGANASDTGFARPRKAGAPVRR